MLTEKHIPITQDYLQPQQQELGSWKRKSLPAHQGQTEFLTNHICKDISCTLSDCFFERDYHSEIHYHDTTTLLIFGLQGLSQFQLQGQTVNHTVRPGDVWLVTAQDINLYRFTPAKVRCRMSVLKFDTQRLNQALKSSDDTQFHLQKNHMQRLGHQEQAEDWLTELAKNPMLSATDRLMAEAKALEVLARWLSPQEQQVQSECSESRILQHVKDLLTADLSQQPSLETLAQQAKMSHARLNRLFKQYFGATVFDWLRQYRMQRAKTYLMDHKRSITDIAFLCGFSSASHFAQSFKKHFACSPSEFRQSRQQ